MHHLVCILINIAYRSCHVYLGVIENELKLFCGLLYKINDEMQSNCENLY